MQPVLAIGHSAGAPLLVRMVLDGQLTLRGLIGLNGALLPTRAAWPASYSPHSPSS